MENNAASKAGSHPFQLVAGHPALDLVNTLDWRFRDTPPEELLPDYGELLRFTEECGLIDRSDARSLARTVTESKGASILAAVRELREAAAQVFYASLDGQTPPAAAIKTLAEIFGEARGRQRLLWRGSKLEWALPPRAATADLPLFLLSESTAELLASDALERVHTCDSPTCRWLFLDTSKNHTRRWCDMKICGNRMKARRFKAQHAQ